MSKNRYIIVKFIYHFASSISKFYRFAREKNLELNYNIFKLIKPVQVQYYRKNKRKIKALVLHF